MLPSSLMLASALLVLLLASPAQSMPEGPARVGWEAIQRGDGEKAAAAFREALASNPRDPSLLTGAAMAAHLLGRDDQAMSSLKRAIEVAPENAYAHYLLGQVAYSQGDLDQVLVQRNTRLPVAAEKIAMTDIVRVTLESPSTNTRLIAIGAAIGAGAAVGVIWFITFLILSGD